MYRQKQKKMEMDEPPQFCFIYRSNGSSYRLRVPLALPYTGDSRELASRLVQSHALPCYLEERLADELAAFSNHATTERWDKSAEENLHGGSVFEKGSETDNTIEKWVGHFSESHAPFSAISSGRDQEVEFSDAYHKLIHSSALETLLQLEHTYALNVSHEVKGWDNARDIMQRKHDSVLQAAMSSLGAAGGKTERDINRLMREHTLERERSESQWTGELTQLQDTQRREYREWVAKVHEDLVSSEEERKLSGEIKRAHLKTRTRLESDPAPYDPEVFPSSNQPPPLEESFSIFLGAQNKKMHNIRLLCGDPLDLCRHKPTTSSLRGGGGVSPSPERLQTAMTLYSTQLSALVVMVDGRVNSLVGMKEAFASVCHQSTDFHFPDIDVQLSRTQEYALSANKEREERKPRHAQNSHSDSQSNLELSENGDAQSGSSSSQVPTPDCVATPTSGGGGVAVGVGSSPLLETTSVSLEPGDFYMTRHSNLSQVHVVLHLVTEETAVSASGLRARHPVVAGLKNCLRTAARHDIHHVTVPLLLVHHMQPEMTINWCLRRAELIFKCVKGFMLENTLWGEGGSRTIQFLIPTGVSDEMFEELCEMIPRIFRVASSRTLTRTRTHSIKQ